LNHNFLHTKYKCLVISFFIDFGFRLVKHKGLAEMRVLYAYDKI
jgi:hypothetical protein